MSNYNTQLQSNNTDLQAVLQTLQSKATPVQATPVISVNSTNGLITATAGTRTSTHQLAFQAAKTITPNTESQIAVSSGYYTGGNVMVAAIPSTYVKPSYTKTAATYTPTTTNQTISAGTYLTGTQTIKGDSNLIAGNIKSGVSIFGVSGTLVEGGGSGDTSMEDALITRNLSVYTNDRVTSVSNYAFYYCTNLTSVNFPVVTSIGISAFQSCTNLTSVNFPKATTIGIYAFYKCTNLTSVNFPVVTSIGSNALNCCTNLSSVNFPKATTIGSFALANCSKLSAIRLGASSVCKLVASNAFSITSIWSNKGSIFVPSSLVASYKNATNWAFFSARIFSTT